MVPPVPPLPPDVPVPSPLNTVEQAVLTPNWACCTLASKAVMADAPPCPLPAWDPVPDPEPPVLVPDPEPPDFVPEPEPLVVVPAPDPVLYPEPDPELPVFVPEPLLALDPEPALLPAPEPPAPPELLDVAVLEADALADALAAAAMLVSSVSIATSSWATVAAAVKTAPWSGVVSIVASFWPVETFWPAFTRTLVTWPEVGKDAVTCDTCVNVPLVAMVWLTSPLVGVVVR